MKLQKWLFCLKTYPVCKVELKKSFNLNLFIEMFGFAGWNTFGAVAMLARNQGIAIILNIFFGTVINASYAIANQINGVISNFSSTIQKSFNPQLMKSEGENNRTRMLMIASFSSKLSVFIFSFMAIPIIIEMPFLLKVWLKQVPENTLMFCRLTIILTFLIQYSSGLMSAIQSIGKIKTYTLTISTLILLNIPIDYFLLKNKLPGFSVMICAIFIEILTLATRIYFANKLSGLSVRMFINNVILKSLFPIFLSFTFCWYISSVINEGILKLLIIGSINAIILIILIFNISLANDEKKKVISLVMFLKQKLCKS